MSARAAIVYVDSFGEEIAETLGRWICGSRRRKPISDSVEAGDLILSESSRRWCHLPLRTFGGRGRFRSPMLHGRAGFGELHAKRSARGAECLYAFGSRLHIMEQTLLVGFGLPAACASRRNGRLHFELLG